MILDENLFNDVNDINLVESFNIVADGYAPDEYDKEWAIDDINNVRVNINDVIEYHVNEDADYFILTFKDGTKKAWYIHSGMYIPDKDFEESLKEAGTQNDLLRTAVQDAYGFNKKEADTYIVNADEKTKEEILRGFTNNAKKNFYDESLKEDFDEVVAIEVPDVNVEIEAEETKPEGPAPGADTGITDLLLSLINDENSTIQTYNSFKASLEDHADFDDVINDIVAEEYNHVGMLQTLLKKISPNSVTIDAGEEEAEDILTKEDNDSLEYGEIIGEIDDSFDNGFGGIFA